MFRTDNSNPWSAEKFIVPWTFLLHILSICRKCGGRGMDNIYKQILLYCHQKFYFISDSCLYWAFDRHKALESCNLITVSGHNQNNNPLLAYYLAIWHELNEIMRVDQWVFLFAVCQWSTSKQFILSVLWYQWLDVLVFSVVCFCNRYCPQV